MSHHSSRSRSAVAGSLLFLVATGCQHADSPRPVAPVSTPGAVAAPAAPQVTQRAPAPVAPPPVQAAGAIVEITAADAPARSLAPAETIPVGKWPEGLVVGDGALWVAESGARRVTRYGLHGDAPRTSRVGRLPVDLVRAGDGRLLAMVATDRSLVAIDGASGRASKLASLPDYPEALCAAGDALWVLLDEGGSSIDSTVVRLDMSGATQARSGLLGANAHGLAHGAGTLWVARADGLTALDPVTLSVLGQVPLPDRPMEVLASDGGVYVGTGAGVVRVDPKRLEVTHRLSLGERVGVLAQYGAHVVAFGERGTFWLLSEATLAPVAAFTGASFEPHAASATADALYVTTHDGVREGGSVLVFHPDESHP